MTSLVYFHIVDAVVVYSSESLLASFSITVPNGTLVFTGNAPEVTTPISIEVPVAALVITGNVPLVGAAVIVPVATLVFSTAAPTAVDLAVHKPQIVYPISDTLAGGWLPSSGGDLFAMLDETPASDADYIFSISNPQVDICRVDIGNLVDPHRSVEHEIRYRYLKEASHGQMNLVVRLMEGASTRATWTHNNIGDTVVEALQTLSGAEADSIVDYTLLELEFEATQAA